MPRPIRVVDNDKYYFITNRCVLGKFLLRPDEETRRILLGCLARAADLHDVELVCFVFLSNHFHLVARFPKRNMAEFMERLQGQIARRINNHRDRSGTVFPERYDDQAILDSGILKDKIEYVLNNPVKDWLVARAEDWQEVSSMGLHKTGEPLSGQWLDHARWTKLERRKGDHDRSEAMREHTVDLHVPKGLNGETPEERRKSLCRLVAQGRRMLFRTKLGDPAANPDVLGFEEAVRRDWRDRPDDPPDSSDRRLLGLSTSKQLQIDYEQRRYKISRIYRHASNAWPDVQLEDFPTGTYPPTCRHCIGHPDMEVA